MPESMGSQKQDKWPAAAKIGRNVKERGTGLLIPDLYEALGHAAPQNLCLLYFPGHLLTSNNHWTSLAHPLLTFREKLNMSFPSNLLILITALASSGLAHTKHLKEKNLFLFNNQLYSRASYTGYILGNLAWGHGEPPKPNPVVPNS